MSVLVVGSVALDSIETPFGKVEEVVGGSATYFSSAASLYAKVNLVGVVGEDFPLERIAFLRERSVDLRGLQVASGRTFRWKGRYDFDLNVAHTLDTQLNVFATFHPVLPPEYGSPRFVFLANIDTDLQMEVLDKVEGVDLSILDTMNYWIENKKSSLLQAISRVNVVTMNEAEARQLVGSYSLIRAAREILSLGPDVLIIKKGEYGAVMFTDTVMSMCLLVDGPATYAPLVNAPVGLVESHGWLSETVPSPQVDGPMNWISCDAGFEPPAKARNYNELGSMWWSSRNLASAIIIEPSHTWARNSPCWFGTV